MMLFKNVILVGTVLEDGYAQISPEVASLWDEETLAFWDHERDKPMTRYKTGQS